MAEVHETGNYVSENGKSIGIRKIKQDIEALKDVKSNERSLFSLVISPYEDIPHVITKLEDWKSDGTYMYAIEAITSAQQILVEYSKVPDNGLIIFTGIVYTDDGNNDVTIGFEPFKLIYARSNRILCTFNIEALTRLLEPEPKHGILARYIEEMHLLQKFINEIEQETNKKSVYGVDTWKCLGDLKILFVWENLDINQYREAVNNAELEIQENTSLLDLLAQVHEYKLFGCKIEFVSDTSPEGSKFCSKYGGIGGILRTNAELEIQENTSLLDLFAQVHDTSPEGSRFCRDFGRIGGILRDQVNIQAYDDDSDDGEN